MRKNQKRFLLKTKVQLLFLVVAVFVVFSLYSLAVVKNLNNFAQDQHDYTTKSKEVMAPIYDPKSLSIRNVRTTRAYKRVTKSMAELPKLPTTNEHVLFFNIVPHTGSEMLVLLLQWLQGWNGFRHVRLKNKSAKSFNWVQQEDLVAEVIDIMKSKAVPLSFEQRYTYFIDFSSFGHQSPTYVNIVRDPFDKFVARYMHEMNLSENSARRLKLKNITEIVEKCVRSQEINCSFGNGILFDLTIPYFCGQHADCTLINNPWALQQAKANVEKYYPVVGVLEETNSTLEVFENKLPFFFKGVQEKYYKLILDKNHRESQKKPTKRGVKKNVRKYFEEMFHMEYEFYYWLRTRLFNQLQMFSSHSH